MIIGLDTGGTHVDGVIIENGQIIDTTKTPTNRENLFVSIWETLEKLLKNKSLKNIKHINLSTTITTNTIIEGKGTPTALFIESGPGIDPQNFTYGHPTVFLDGCIDHRGWEIKPVTKRLLHQELKSIIADGIKSAAVVTKFSTRNPSHELQVKDILIKHNFSPVTVGHTLSGKLSFPRRIYTAYLNSAIYNSFNGFSQAIKRALRQKGLNIPVYILKADGGTMTLDEATEYPVQTILSGPAASVMGSLAFFQPRKDTLLLDIGGTTTDISFLANGVPLFMPDGIKIAEYPTLVRAIYNISLGLGGDSTVKISDTGTIMIGPQRQGPPMALGGPVPTPSDAMIVLGKLNFGNREKAVKAMKILGNKLNILPKEAAEKVYDRFGELIKNKVTAVLEEINNHPVYTIHQLLHGKKIEPENIIVIGGPAPGVAPILEKKFNLPYQIPKNFEIANAVGAALTRRTFEITLLADTEQGTLAVPEMGIYRKIATTYDLSTAKEDALNLLKKQLSDLNATSYLDKAEIIEASSFNMIRGFFTSGKNIRVRAQIKPGLISRIGGIF